MRYLQYKSVIELSCFPLLHQTYMHIITDIKDLFLFYLNIHIRSFSLFLYNTIYSYSKAVT